jgi:hypothetical protein
MNKGTGFAFALLLPVLSACTWVPLTDQGVRVQLCTLEQARACEHKSRVTVSVKGKIAGIARNEDKMRGELETLAPTKPRGSGVMRSRRNRSRPMAARFS